MADLDTPQMAPKMFQESEGTPCPGLTGTNVTMTLFAQQLGVRLESTKAPVDYLVVEPAEKPAAN